MSERARRILELALTNNTARDEGRNDDNCGELLRDQNRIPNDYEEAPPVDTTTCAAVHVSTDKVISESPGHIYENNVHMITECSHQDIHSCQYLSTDTATTVELKIDHACSFQTDPEVLTYFDETTNKTTEVIKITTEDVIPNIDSEVVIVNTSDEIFSWEDDVIRVNNISEQHKQHYLIDASVESSEAAVASSYTELQQPCGAHHEDCVKITGCDIDKQAKTLASTDVLCETDQHSKCGPDCDVQAETLAGTDVFGESDQLFECGPDNDAQAGTDDFGESSVGDDGLRKKRGRSKKENRKLEIRKGKKNNLKPNPCVEGKCKNKCFCISEAERLEIFQNYWEINTYEEKKNWLLSCVEDCIVKRRRVPGDSRRTKTCVYSITLNGVKKQVCLQFLLKTLDISHRMLSYTKKNCTKTNTANRDNRGRHAPANKTPHEKRKAVMKFIKKLPAMNSHYCRRDSSRRYLPSEFRNLSNLYRVYKSDVGKELCVKERVFRNIFNKEFNIGFHVPKKDKCTLCEKNKQKGLNNLSQEESLKFSEHLQLKESAKTTFDSAQKRGATDPTYLCTSFDLQKVLNTPKGESMLLYYSRKYSVYNLTFYESHTREGFCYVWGEADGQRGANEICTIVHRYLSLVDSRGQIKEIDLFCDSCPGQNKNKHMLSMIYVFLQTSKNMKSIRITYLLPGHTYMPVDSMHATIENFTKKRHIWAPSEWPTMISNSRVNPKPYNTEVMKHQDFADWKVVTSVVFPRNLTCTSGGSKVQFSAMKSCMFQKGEHEVMLRYTYNSDNEEPTAFAFVRRPSNRNVHLPEEALYQTRLPVTQAKYKDLCNLCAKGVIPVRFHHEYQQLPHKGGSGVERLPETDDEDEYDV